ncbi:bifunctional phosphopantothenoylcysteine decarboxylase/phosphopantothenate--cysteine ligase CoaBC [Candidatus Woesearchaeota archaeon]|nr:bifunctional phosphopantothenoylcysteine decarboxylase/phosphopantothenate--cysteine ligase CoaBC [Candidatus Woesearchaeota archaeon]
MKTIVLGITGSIACFKALDLVQKLKPDFNIEVIMTKNALNLIDKKEFEAILKKKVHTGLFYPGFDYHDYLKREQSEHISLADMSDLFVICPATANTIGKIANGIADDLLTTSVMAASSPVLVCPAMNCRMWENKILQKNISELKKLGYSFVDPEKGRLACGCSGIGRLADINKIAESIKSMIDKKTILKNRRIIVTAGATVEEIDPVRVITNKSSGKMGIYIAEEAAKLGADVTLIRGKTEVEPEGKITDIQVSSVDEMLDQIKKTLNKSHAMIHAAAVSDFKLDENSMSNKLIKNKKIKSRENKSLSLRLKPTIKIINEIKKENKKIKLVGFKAEYNVSREELLKSAHSLLKDSNADFIVANDVGKGVFGSENNDVYIVGKSDKKKGKKINDKTTHIKGSKRDIANKILDLIK